MDIINTIGKDNVLFSYVTGSHLYNLNTKDSDVDTKGIFIASKEQILGFNSYYKGQISDEKNDNNFYEIGKFMEMLLKSNPSALEALFVPKSKIIIPPNDIIMPLFENKEQFITKDCFRPFIGYAKEQIEKAKGLNKMINWEKDRVTRKTILDFTYTFFKQGSTNIQNWLEYRGLNQKYCGLVKIPNMRDTYGVYYDWGNFFLHEEITANDVISAYADSHNRPKTSEIVSMLKNANSEEEKDKASELLKKSHLMNMAEFIVDFYHITDISEWYSKNTPIGYSGCVGKNSQSLRLSSVSKGEKPICYVSFNEDAYVKHCKDYKNYKDWEKNRNQIRYQSNLNKNYDSKNLCHCVRLIHMGIEIAEGKGVILERTEDREFLMNIRNHKYEYNELIEIIDNDNNRLKTAIEKSTIKEHLDTDFVNDLLINIRKKAYNW